MEPVHRALAADTGIELHLLVTGMHLMPEFSADLEQVRSDKFGRLHEADMLVGGNTGRVMAQSIGHGVVAAAALIDEIRPDIVLLQGDRGEMLAAAISAAHMNVPVVHMSGGDFSGSIDDSVRNAISKLAHFHLTNCDASTRRLIGMAEQPERIVEVGDPGIDRLRTLDFLPFENLASELKLRPGEPFLIATLHPVTDEVAQAGLQMQTLLEALQDVGLTTIFTYPNADQGGYAMKEVLEAWRDRCFIRIEPSLGSRRYLSLLRHAAAIVGNSSSGLFDAPSLGIPAIDIGSRQHNRVAAPNVVRVSHERAAIANAVRFVLADTGFRRGLANCRNPYGDGHAAERTIDVLHRLRIGAALLAKWRAPTGPFLLSTANGI
jgi:UDP-N-acetylglucosamine 2-epimerase (non-hydrolysing)/GDP/UDP-N,N'-diacetylbacillosamine 2-epimerase (hydrolysing)